MILLKSVTFINCIIFIFLIPFISKSQVKDTSHLLSPDLKIVIANNESYGKEHKQGYGGVAELYNSDSSQRNVFVSKYAGLNFEHIFSGDSSSYRWNMYECRIAPMEIIKLSDIKTELLQSRTQHWPLKSSIIYEFKDNGIDFTYSGTPLYDIWKKHGFIGLFFASYINEPVEKGIYFIGQSAKDKGNLHPQWIYHLPENHGLNACHRSAESKWLPVLDTPGFPVSLVTGISDYNYVYPFYYGLVGDSVLIMMFKNPGKDAEISFTQSPDGGGQKNPAWDFILYQKNYKVGRKFSFHGRLVYKKFEGKEDVIKIYEHWSGKKVVMPKGS